MQCLNGILIARKNNTSKREIRETYPLFNARFPALIDILESQKVTWKNFDPKGSQELYDGGRTFLQCIALLIQQTAQFGAIAKRAKDETMPEWVLWYEKLMQKWPIFYNAYHVLMRKICEGRLGTDAIGCNIFATRHSVLRGVITGEQQESLIGAYINRKGVYGPQIEKLRITEEEWTAAIDQYFAENP